LIALESHGFTILSASFQSMDPDGADLASADTFSAGSAQGFFNHHCACSGLIDGTRLRAGSEAGIFFAGNAHHRYKLFPVVFRKDLHPR
jgi:hypothetical protein